MLESSDIKSLKLKYGDSAKVRDVVTTVIWKQARQA
jgi:hypothetical protein